MPKEGWRSYILVETFVARPPCTCISDMCGGVVIAKELYAFAIPVSEVPAPVVQVWSGTYTECVEKNQNVDELERYHLE